jgi:predicted regulator of Ras-like GTPase activity (Roadblock/LC7/MglB family)
MSFDSILGQVLRECPGAVGAALMGSDGVPIAEVAAPNARELGDEVGLLGVEFGRILDEARKAADSLGGGAVEEACLSMTRFWVLLRAIGDEAFLVLVLAPDGNLGKARFLMRRHLAELREHL